MELERYIKALPSILDGHITSLAPWEAVSAIPEIVRRMLAGVRAGFRMNGDVAVHEQAAVESGAVVKGPAVISRGCFVAAGAYLRNGVFLEENVTIGPSCEIRNSLIFRGSRIAHLSFVGDSLVGEDVNLEAGVVIANHWNERDEKRIRVVIDGLLCETGMLKFGAIIGDHARIGANSVTVPGTILNPASVVSRLQLVDQVAEFFRQQIR